MVPALAQTDVESSRKKAEVCIGCHGVDGNSTDPLYPVLAGQTQRYTYLQLRDYKEGRRKDTVMTPLAELMSREDMLDLGEFFAAQKPKPLAFRADATRVDAGRKKAEETLCTMCHQGGFSGQNEIPRVAGQHPEYIAKQLKDFKARSRTNDAGTMISVSNTLSDDDIENLAHYIANLN